MVIIVAGLELVTAADVKDRWGDVRAARLRAWCQATPSRGPLLAPVTVARLAALYGVPVPPRVDPRRPARVKGPSGPCNLYEWAAVVRAEKRARAATSGPSRRITTGT
jgi:hypothetical protein